MAGIRSADFDVSRSGKGHVQHFDDVRNDVPGVREDCAPFASMAAFRVVLADHGGAVPQDSHRGQADLRIGNERFPVVDTEPHAEVKPVGEVLEQYLAIVCAHVDRGVTPRAPGQGRADLVVSLEDGVSNGPLNAVIGRPYDLVAKDRPKPFVGWNELRRDDECCKVAV